ncbi:Transcription factor bHLH18 [Zea mays]|nr:Transcription factor bHLH18 [Zea mays]
MDEPSFFHQWQSDTLLEQYTEQQIAVAFGQGEPVDHAVAAALATAMPMQLQQPAAAEQPHHRPRKAAKVNTSWDSCITEQGSPAADSSSPTILSFGGHTAEGAEAGDDGRRRDAAVPAGAPGQAFLRRHGRGGRGRQRAVRQHAPGLPEPGPHLGRAEAPREAQPALHRPLQDRPWPQEDGQGIGARRRDQVREAAAGPGEGAGGRRPAAPGRGGGAGQEVPAVGRRRRGLLLRRELRCHRGFRHSAGDRGPGVGPHSAGQDPLREPQGGAHRRPL